MKNEIIQSKKYKSGKSTVWCFFYTRKGDDKLFKSFLPLKKHFTFNKDIAIASFPINIIEDK